MKPNPAAPSPRSSSHAGLLALAPFLAVALLLSGCIAFETDRRVLVDLELGEIAVSRGGRFPALVSIEGPLPKIAEGAYIVAREKFPGTGRVELAIPDSAWARHGALQSGRIVLDFDRRVAQVQVAPSAKYRGRLHLDGEYPIVFAELHSRATRK